MKIRIESNQSLHVNEDDVRDAVNDAARDAVQSEIDEFDFDQPAREALDEVDLQDYFSDAADDFDFAARIDDAVDDYDFAPSIEEAIEVVMQRTAVPTSNAEDIAVLQRRLDFLERRNQNMEAVLLDIGRSLSAWANAPVNR